MLCVHAWVPQISRLGVTVAAVVHQPSWEIFAMFADLLLLCDGGRTAYYGPVSDVQVSTPDVALCMFRVVHAPS